MILHNQASSLWLCGTQWTSEDQIYANFYVFSTGMSKLMRLYDFDTKEDLGIFQLPESIYRNRGSGGKGKFLTLTRVKKPSN